MLSSNTNKLTWVGIAVGVVGLLGVSTIALFPSAMDSVKTNVIQVATQFTGNTDKGVVDDYDTSNHNYTFDDTNKTAVIGSIKTGKDEDKGSVVMPSHVTKSGVTYTVVGIDADAYRNSTELTDVVIPDNVKTIGKYAFSNTALSSVTVPDNVKTIEEGAFYNNAKLTNVTIGTGVETIGTGSFQRTALSSVTIPDNVTSMGKSAFAYSPNLTNVTIGKGLETIPDGAFRITALSSVTIPDNVKTIEQSAFSKNPNLTKVTIGKGVETIGDSAFWKTALSSVTIPDNVKTIEQGAFTDIPNNKDGFASIGKATTYTKDGKNAASFGGYQDNTGNWIAYKPNIRN